MNCYSVIRLSIFYINNIKIFIKLVLLHFVKLIFLLDYCLTNIRIPSLFIYMFLHLKLRVVLLAEIFAYIFLIESKLKFHYNSMLLK